MMAPYHHAQVGLADVVRALHKLDPDSRTKSDVLSLLGFAEDPTVRDPRTRRGVDPGPTPADRPAPEVPRRRASGVAPTSRTTARTPSEPASELHLPWRRYLRPVDRRLDLGSGPQPTALPVAALAVVEPALPPTPLLPESTAPRLIEAATTTEAGDGELLLDELVEAFARRTRLDSLPRGPRPSMFRGVQVLVDVSEEMAPFHEDCAGLAATLRDTVGADLVEELAFRTSPLDGVGTGSAWTWGAYRPPPLGTPVVAVTELGIVARPGRVVAPLTRAWLRLATLLARRDSALRVLVPFPRERWPAALSRSARIMEWDRSVTESEVRHGKAPASGRPDAHDGR
jgi:hypothetical protein